MKKILCMLLFLVGALSLQAQVAIGGMVGLNYSKLKISHDVPLLDIRFQEMDIGYFIGLNSKVVLNEKMHFLGDLKYAVRGYLYPNGDGSFNTKFRINYFELAPKIEFRPLDNIGIALGVNFGIYGGGTFKERKEDWKAFTEELDLFRSNLAFTVSIRRYLRNFFIEFGYEYGFKNVSELTFDGPDPSYRGNYRADWRNFNLGVGYLFDL